MGYWDATDNIVSSIVASQLYDTVIMETFIFYYKQISMFQAVYNPIQAFEYYQKLNFQQVYHKMNESIETYAS